MTQSIHILNGKALKQQFPEQLDGEIIVFHECLVDGNVEGDSLQEFFEVRSRFISTFYQGIDKDDYYHLTVSELEKIKLLPDSAVINLWFEDDLFCQVNFWFLVHYLFNLNPSWKLYLVRPPALDHLGFGGLNQEELVTAFHNKIYLDETGSIAMLWRAYKTNDKEKLAGLARSLLGIFPFISKAVTAHLERIPTEHHPGRPKLSLIKIMKELKTDEFDPVFRAFSKRESIYGFGDLQVKRLLEDIKLQH